MDDDLWALIEPLLPPWPARSPGPRPVTDRLCLQGILYVLSNDIAWQLLPPELGFGSGQTCWRRLERWQQAGVFDQLHRLLPAGSTGPGFAWMAPTSGRKRGLRHRSVAGRPAEDRQQTPPDLRRTRHPTQGHHDRGERQRRHPAPRPGRRHPTGGGPPRPAPQASRAVLQGLSARWNSGPVEGRVNHIMMVKRQMFGRAKLPLLRKRVLLTAAANS